MANPTIVDCPKDTWTKVATNVISGEIVKSLTTARPVNYLYVRRDTGTAAPTTKDEGYPIFTDDHREVFGAKVGSDIYIYAIKEDGKVMVDM